jgi:hypothetical protein
MRAQLRFAISIAVVAGLAAGAVLRAARSHAADKPGAPKVSTRAVMIVVHSGKRSLLSRVSTDIGKPEPDWNAADKSLAEVIRLMSMLTKQKPPRGSQKAWDKLVEDYVQKVKVARQNVKEHKPRPARAALEKLGSTCDKCHDDHGIN